MTAKSSRVIEDVGFIAAILVGVLYGVMETAAAGGLLPRAPAVRPFPYGVLMVICALALPKTLGRATAGRIWDRLFGGKLRDTPPGE